MENKELDASRSDLQRLTLQRDDLELLVQERTAELVEMTRHLQYAREDERHRLARDLHDELGALLTSAKLDAARIRARLGDGAPLVLERLDHLVETLNTMIQLKRRIVEDLRPSALDHLGLSATLHMLGTEFSERSGLPVHCELEEVALPPASQLVLYRLVQEAINNISKHAQASQVWLSLTTADGRAHITVRDDGLGFDPRFTHGASFGLLSMRFRVEAEQGEMQLHSKPGAGTRVEAWLPLLA